MIDGKDFVNQPINSNLKTYGNIRKIVADQGDEYITGCLLHYSYVKDHSKRLQQIQVNNELLMQTQEQFYKIVLQQIQIEKKTQQYSLLLKKRKKLYLNFHKEL